LLDDVLDGVMLGVARASFDPTVPVENGGYVYGAYATPDAWMVEVSSGNLYHDYLAAQTPTDWGSKGRFEAGRQVGLVLRNGQVLVLIEGKLLGVMADGLVGEFVWAADLSISEPRSVGIEPQDAADFHWPCCSSLCYPCGSGTACDFCDGSCNSAGASYCDGAHPSWDENCNRAC
jgi:hypothetical protein